MSWEALPRCHSEHPRPRLGKLEGEICRGGDTGTPIRSDDQVKWEPSVSGGLWKLMTTTSTSHARRGAVGRYWRRDSGTLLWCVNTGDFGECWISDLNMLKYSMYFFLLLFYFIYVTDVDREMSFTYSRRVSRCTDISKRKKKKLNENGLRFMWP